MAAPQQTEGPRTGRRAPPTWAEYWNEGTTIYVSPRHKSVHYRAVADDILRHVPANGRVVDYGCGDALHADRVAEACAHLFLCESAASVRERLRARYAGAGNISILTPEQFEQLDPLTIDAIVVNSVVQYLSEAQFTRLLAVWRSKLRPAGRLVLADIVPRNVSPYRDAMELVKFAAANGFLFAALKGLARSYFSGYRKIREGLGFLQLDEAEVLGMLEQAGLAGNRHYPNIGHNARRMTFVATVAGPDAGAARA